MTTTLGTKARALIERPIIASVASVDPDGGPQLTYAQFLALDVGAARIAAGGFAAACGGSARDWRRAGGSA